MTTDSPSGVAERADTFEEDVVAGLGSTPKRIAAKWFYDAEGSRLFEAITRLPEYYLTNAELGILRVHSAEIARLCGPEALIIEYGSGSSTKTRLLLDHLERQAGYVPVDIACETLAASAQAIRTAYPALAVMPLCVDYTEPLELPELPPHRRRVAFFPGSTIGNFEPVEASGFLESVAEAVGHGGGMVLGVDMKKDRSTLEAAYNDEQGVTAEFNRNVLVRINRETGADFRPHAFRHVALYNDEAGRIEMHLESAVDQVVRVSGHEFALAAGERIHTENSYKFSVQDVHSLAESAGFRVVEHWTDQSQLFGVFYLTC